MAKIDPTVGRVVWFHSSGAHPAFDADEPHAALVAKVLDDGRLNLAVFDSNGSAHPVSSVILIQDGDKPPTGDYAEWMPYQKGQAAKTEQAESNLDATRRIASAGEPLIGAKSRGK